MLKTLLKNSSLYPVLKYIRLKLFPSQAQIDDRRLVAGRVSFYRQFLLKGDLCFDVGANIGNRTEVFLEIGCKVVAVEPQVDCSQILKYRFGGKVIVIQKALGEKQMEGTLFVSDTSEISSLSTDWINSVSKSRFINRTWTREQKVNITTLDSLIFQYGVPKFCKIDVEGYEFEVLKGLSHPIPVISFEYTIPEKVENVQQCLERLSTIGSFECNFTIGEKMEFESDRWLSPGGLVKQLHLVSTTGLFGDIYVRFNNSQP